MPTKWPGTDVFVVKTFMSDWFEFSSQETNLFNSPLPPAACHIRFYSSYILAARRIRDITNILLVYSLGDVADTDDVIERTDITSQPVS